MCGKLRNVDKFIGGMFEHVKRMQEYSSLPGIIVFLPGNHYGYKPERENVEKRLMRAWGVMCEPVSDKTPAVSALVFEFGKDAIITDDLIVDVIEEIKERAKDEPLVLIRFYSYKEFTRKMADIYEEIENLFEPEYLKGI